ncbi:MAG: hypothetical protein ACRCV6_01510 [Formosimonas sp.]
MKQIWNWLKDTKNQATLRFLGGAMVAILAFLGYRQITQHDSPPSVMQSGGNHNQINQYNGQTTIVNTPAPVEQPAAPPDKPSKPAQKPNPAPQKHHAPSSSNITVNNTGSGHAVAATNGSVVNIGK